MKYTLKKCRNRHAGSAKLVTVSEDYLLNLLKKQEGKCAYTNLPMTLPTMRGCEDRRLCASLDRIDSSMGYIEGNVQ